MKQKYNWKLLKQKYMNSDIGEVAVFIRSELGKEFSGNIGRNTRGRKEEKEQYLKEIADEAIERNKEKTIEALEIPIETLKKAKMMAIGKIIKLINQGNLSVSDIVKGLASIKTELGEPDHIGANYNINQNKNDSLTQEELDALDVLFNMKGKHKKQ